MFEKTAWQKEYDRERNSKEWQYFRHKVVHERDDYKCFKCGGYGNNAAHRYYQDTVNGVRPKAWDYPIEDMITLCYDCHWTENAKFMKPAVRRLTLSLKKKFLCDDIKAIAEGLENTKALYFDHEFSLCLKELFENGELQAKVRNYYRAKYPETANDMVNNFYVVTNEL